MTSLNIPCLIIHKGYKPYLKSNLEITSKNNKIYIIGDSTIQKLEKINENITFINIKEYENNSTIKSLKKSYINYSTNNSIFEWECFQRPFIMQQFAKEQNYEKVFHIDSDNILLININSLIFEKEIAYCVPSFQDNLRMDSSIHCGLLSEKFFENYKKLYIDIFENKSKFDLIENKIHHHKKNNLKGGICDMTFYYLLQKLNMIYPQNLLAPIKNDKGDEFIFINNLNTPVGFFSLNNFKTNSKNLIKIYKGNLVKDIVNNKFIRIANIHFQGKSKKYLNMTTKYKLKY